MIRATCCPLPARLQGHADDVVRPVIIRSVFVPTIGSYHHVELNVPKLGELPHIGQLPICHVLAIHPNARFRALEECNATPDVVAVAAVEPLAGGRLSRGRFAYALLSVYGAVCIRRKTQRPMHMCR